MKYFLGFRLLPDSQGNAGTATSTVKTVLDTNRGVGPGFDVLRIALAVIIFAGHISWLVGRTRVGAMPATALNPAAHEGWSGWYRPILVSYVPAFFALSGFLVMGSAVRTRATQTFLMFRALRIFPALAVELCLSAFVLGLWFTSLSPADYIRDPGFFRYFGNLVGIVDFQLPGVFDQNIVRNIVNANLWTLPAEFDCYLTIAVLMFSGLLYRRRSFSILFAVVTVLFALLNMFGNFSVSPTTLPPVAITYYFFVGVMLFQWREHVPVGWPFFLISAGCAYLLQTGHHTVYLAPLFVAYCTIFIGMLKFPRLPIIDTGDYSYGIYLYGFPITQAVLAAFPSLHGNRFATLALAGSLTLGFAAFSWHVVEKRALKAKKHLPRLWFPTAVRETVALPKDRSAISANALAE